RRQEANDMAHSRPHPRHYSNGDEQKFRHKKKTDDHHKKLDSDQDKNYKESRSLKGTHLTPEKTLKLEGKPSYLVSFTKGLPHNFETGLVQNPDHFQYLVRAIDSGDPRDFRDTPLGFPENIGLHEHHNRCVVPYGKSWESAKANSGNMGKRVGLRAWESQSAGLAFDLEGPDAHAVTMPPAPRLGSAELSAEMAEVYAQALLRDVPFAAFSAGVICRNGQDELELVDEDKLKALETNKGDVETVKKFTDKLNLLEWFAKNSCDPVLCLDQPEKARHRGGAKQSPSASFRGITFGDDIGPYLSQFLLIGNSGINNKNDNTPELKAKDGKITYGANVINQRVRVAKAKDYMTTWEEWFDVQNAADVTGLESYTEKERRFIYTPRDLATYVHFDALYQAYLNACLILLARKTPFDPGIPFQEPDDRDHQQGFAHFGGPHILSLVTEVATRALKAVRFQKFNVHRRCRPEVLAARIAKAKTLGKIPELEKMVIDLGPKPEDAEQDCFADILEHVARHNDNQNGIDTNDSKYIPSDNYLLPMAFCEGSPMHPAYGAGHATVAGACVTILKAFFDAKHPFAANGMDANQAYVTTYDEDEKDYVLKLVPVFDQYCKPAHLTVEGELNKLAANISIGRDWAGVHYFTDYYESILMGEQIAIGILEEQKLMFGENFSITLPMFNGNTIRI
ncbi:MAG: vanadium-dependent haloperoxidase, partial [Bacteroidota bacterium]